VIDSCVGYIFPGLLSILMNSGSYVWKWLHCIDYALMMLVWRCSEQPCKTDADVIRALETAHISPIDYPLVYQWRNNVLSYPEDVRSRLVVCCTFLCHTFVSCTVASFANNTICLIGFVTFLFCMPSS